MRTLPRIAVLLTTLCLLAAPAAGAPTADPQGQWLGAPVMPGGKVVADEEGRRVLEYPLPYERVHAWYRAALAAYPDARYRDWKEEMYIEDQGGARWHAIVISKNGGARTQVTFKRDSWSWILSTLLIRFVGVFVVLLVLWACLGAATAVLRRASAEEEEPDAEEACDVPPVCAAEGLSAEAAAAVCVALHLHLSAARGRSAPERAAGGPAPWALAGRISALKGLARERSR